MDPKQASVWLKIIQMDHWEPKSHDRICSDHFEGGISILELLTPMNNYVKHVMRTKNMLTVHYIYVLYANARFLMSVMTRGVTHVHVLMWYDLTIYHTLGRHGLCLYTREFIQLVKARTRANLLKLRDLVQTGFTCLHTQNQD
jgi:hypothetical protein